MSLTRYPDTFPYPDDLTITGTVDVGLRRTSVPVVLANQVKDYNAPRIEISMTFSMTNDIAATWFAWINNMSWRWFLMDIVSPYKPVDIVSEHTVRIISDLIYTKLGDNWNSITATFEVLQNDKEDGLVPDVEYDWVVAGTPASPSVDYYYAGTPDMPSTGGIILSHIYWY